MKKSLICTALIILDLTSFSIAEEKVELLPEVKELITPKSLDPKLLENSYSVGLLGLLYPSDDYYEVAKQTVKTNYEILMDPKSSKPLRLMKDQLPEEQIILAWSENTNQLHNDLLLCAEYMAPNCVAKTIQSRDNIKQLIKDNQKLLERYNDIVKKSDKYTDLFFMFSDAEPYDFPMEILTSHHIRVFFLLTLNKAMLQFNDQKFDHAIENLQMIKKSLWLLTPDHETVSLVAQMIAVAYRANFDFYLNAILDAGFLANEFENPDVIALFQPYPKQYRDSLLETFVLETNFILKTYASKSDQKSSNEALNQSYLLAQRLIKTIKNNTFSAQKEQLVKECEALNTQYEDICSVFAFDDYLKRYDTQSNYHNMIYLKYLILRDNIQDQDIPAFLKTQGEIAIDLITQEPFQWNAETRTIFIPLPKDKHLPTQIRMAVMKNPDIKNLQVTIPKRVSK